MRIVFMGTPEFAIPTLNMLIQKHNVVCVVTKQDKPKGRGKEIAASPIKLLALEHGINVLQPQSASDEAFIESLKEADADLFVTCAYGKILPAKVLEIPRYGCVNVHASILPKYRGAAPLWHAVINGESESGITTMMTDIGMDTGDILFVDKVAMGRDMTMGELHDALAELGPRTLERTIEAIADGSVKRVAQIESDATYAPMVTRETGRIDWSRSAESIHNLVRGTNPFPVAYAYSQEGRLKIWRTAVADGREPFGAAGSVMRCSEGLFVSCGEGVIQLLEVQADNARRMSIGEYLNGHTITELK